MIWQGVNAGSGNAFSGNRSCAALDRRLDHHGDDPIRKGTTQGLVEENAVEMGVPEPVFPGESIDEVIPDSAYTLELHRSTD